MKKKRRNKMMMMIINWSQRSSRKGFKGRIGSHGRKTSTRFTKKRVSRIRNITHNTGGTAVRN